eukprot:COSAG03_NODE_2345_length_2863_cov_33.607698_2_plen_388_part_00
MDLVLMEPDARGFSTLHHTSSRFEGLSLARWLDENVDPQERSARSAATRTYWWAQVLGLSDKSPGPWRKFVLFICLTSVYFLPWAAVGAKESTLYEQRHTAFGYIFAAICSCGGGILIAGWFLQYKAMQSSLVFGDSSFVTAGHMLRLLSEVNMADQSSSQLRWWTTTGLRLIMGLATLLSLQGFAWLQWFWKLFTDEGPLYAMMWVWMYFFVLPVWTHHVAYQIAAVGISSAAVEAYLQQIDNIVPKNREEYDESKMPGVLDAVMDVLVNVNNGVMKTKTNGWGLLFFVMYVFMSGAGLCLVFKVLLFDMNTAAKYSQFVQDLVGAATILLFMQATLLLPCKASTECHRVRSIYYSCMHGFHLRCRCASAQCAQTRLHGADCWDLE